MFVTLFCKIFKLVIIKSNWTKWSTTQGVITQVISKADAAQGQLEITSMITPYISGAFQ